MPRPKKKEIKLTEQSAVALMQELYNETVEQRNTAIRIQNKMLSFMKEPEDMTLIGPVLEKQQKIIDSAIEKKLQLSKLISSMITKNISSSASIDALDIDLKEAILNISSQNKKDDTPSGTVKYEL